MRLNNKWIWRARPVLSARFRLICIPHAGGTVGVFKDWHTMLPDWIDLVAVSMPGRQQRSNETMPTRMGMLVREMASGLEPVLNLPYAFVGSCTGSLIAYELADHLRKKELSTPEHLFVTSCRAPHLPDRDAPIHKYNDEDLVAALSELGGTPAALLEHPEMMRIFGPVLRRDFELSETYTYLSKPPLDLPITAFGGKDDQVVTHAEMAAWQEHTTAYFNHSVLSGGHYLVEDAAQTLCAEIGEACKVTVS